ncbi:Type III restriction enzyme Res [Helicobacter sp. NHP21005]|uniref:type III restriction-modification system endonuclease n=1 Tax=Helicobacter felistomachi TaxID=3040201 RepID=UPI0025730321|nr:type III restriction-modification system endonuclease [Helicobacter sp. NHP21005]BEG57693.1 Type III restriction enzyme Res [Helicobacter sp. NHP21005]
MANFEYSYEHLPHQERAVQAILKVFDGFSLEPSRPCANPKLLKDKALFASNLHALHNQEHIEHTRYTHLESHTIDISMETGTGKTYTYTKAMCALHQHFQQSKFILVVPSLAIKAGVAKFLREPSVRAHFRDLYQVDLSVHVISSQASKGFPSALSDFVKAPITPHKIEVLLINQGMINAPSLEKSYDTTLFDTHTRPFDALKGTNPILIIDEPHRFKKDQKSFKNLEKIAPSWILRFGATFENTEENLIYRLNAMQAFNQNLVKGVQVFTHGLGSHTPPTQLVGLSAYEAKFKQGTRIFSIGQKESLSKIAPELNLTLEKVSSRVALLSNGLELRLKDSLNPDCYTLSLRDQMIDKALDTHFELERQLLSRPDKIKPLLLFFIDDIVGYRGGGFQEAFNALLTQKLQALLTQEKTRPDTNPFYVAYLQKSLADVAATHGGYFARDNLARDEKIEAQITEILHDKERLLSLDNPRRFIFSQWTLKEGWDNPNVFGICKLRSSGSETSKLQEVGRGLRLPVNEHGARIHSENFYLNYFVDFSEKDFVAKLVGEINTSTQLESSPTKLEDALIEYICRVYQLSDTELLENLDQAGVIDRTNHFKEGGFETLKALYPQAFLKADKIKNAKDRVPKAHIRAKKYEELKEFWEKINQKALLHYLGDEEDFCQLLINFLQKHREGFKTPFLGVKKETLQVQAQGAHSLSETLNMQMSTPNMPYGAFLSQLALETHTKALTWHKAFCALKDFDINLYCHNATIRHIQGHLASYLLDHALKGGGGFNIAYEKIAHNPHPTFLTDARGNALIGIDPSPLGVQKGDTLPAQNYLFEELYYDSQLERENIVNGLEGVCVFSKIPKNSLKIPMSGGGTYSPDFVYVLENGRGFVVETKGKQERALMADEAQKIAHARKFFKEVLGVEFVLQDEQKGPLELLKKRAP